MVNKSKRAQAQAAVGPHQLPYCCVKLNKASNCLPSRTKGMTYKLAHPRCDWPLWALLQRCAFVKPQREMAISAMHRMIWRIMVLILCNLVCKYTD